MTEAKIEIIKTHICKGCKLSLPLTGEWFYAKTSNQKSYLDKSLCKVCRSHHIVSNRNKADYNEKSRNTKRLKRIEDAAALGKILKPRMSSIMLAEKLKLVNDIPLIDINPNKLLEKVSIKQEETFDKTKLIKIKVIKPKSN